MPGPIHTRGKTSEETIKKLRFVFLDEPDLSIDALGQRFNMSASRVNAHTKDLMRPPKGPTNLTAFRRKRNRKFLFSRTPSNAAKEEKTTKTE